MSVEANIPCGKCGCGTYDFYAWTSNEAVNVKAGQSIPKCKTYDRLCVGATDVLAAYQNEFLAESEG